MFIEIVFGVNIRGGGRGVYERYVSFFRFESIEYFLYDDRFRSWNICIWIIYLCLCDLFVFNDDFWFGVEESWFLNDDVGEFFYF